MPHIESKRYSKLLRGMVQNLFDRGILSILERGKSQSSIGFTGETVPRYMYTLLIIYILDKVWEFFENFTSRDIIWKYLHHVLSVKDNQKGTITTLSIFMVYCASCLIMYYVNLFYS